METLADIIPAEQQLLELQQKLEPDFDDLSDLDALLEQSIALNTKKPNKRVYKETKDAVDAFLAHKPVWEILENIEVWQMTKCKCGGLGTMTFVRYMQKLKKVGQAVLHWETVKELKAEDVRRFALVERDVERCEFCADLHIEEFRAFQEVIG